MIFTHSLTTLLTEVQKVTGKQFIVAHHFGADAEEGKQYWFNPTMWDKKPMAVFSHRPFPKKWEAHRLAKYNTASENFLRVDMEFPKHSDVPTPADKVKILDFAKKSRAMGVQQTKHGYHVYYLSDKSFIAAADNNQSKSICLQLQDDFQKLHNGKLIVCSSSWSENSWSRVHNPDLIYMDLFARLSTTQNTKNNHYTYCAKTISISKSKSSTCKNSCTKNFNEKGGTLAVGSRQAERTEFSSILQQISAGKNIDDIAMQFHKPEAIKRTIETAGYEWVLAKKCGKTWDLLGPDSTSRCIQRDFSFRGHLKHSLHNLATSNYTDAGILTVFSSTAYDDIRDEMIKRHGMDWQKELILTVEWLRNEYGNNIGNLTVSKESIKKAIEMTRTQRVITLAKLQEMLKENKQRNKFHTMTGSSTAQAYRLRKLLVLAGLLEGDRVARRGKKEDINIIIALATKPPVAIVSIEVDENEEVTVVKRIPVYVNKFVPALNKSFRCTAFTYKELDIALKTCNT